VEPDLAVPVVAERQEQARSVDREVDGFARRLHGSVLILLGVAYVLVGVTFLLTPEVIRTDAELGGHLAAYGLGGDVWRSGFFLACITVSLLGCIGVAAVSRRVGHDAAGVVRWTEWLAQAGFVALGVTSLRWLQMEGALAALYLGSAAPGKPGVAAAVVPVGMDPHGWLIYGGLAVWTLSVSVHGRTAGGFSRGLAVLGVLASAVYAMALAGNAVGSSGLLSIAALGSVSIGPVWYVALGVWMLRD
jgi:hypothetical protein